MIQSLQFASDIPPSSEQHIVILGILGISVFPQDGCSIALLRKANRRSISVKDEAQFQGRILQLELERIWCTKAESKVKFHIWLMIQNRLWTGPILLHA